MTTETVKKKRPVWHWIGGAIGLLFLCGIISTLASDDDADAPVADAPAVVEGASEASTAEPEAPTAEPTAAPLAPSWTEIKEFRRTATDVGWDAYRETLVGTRVESWAGTVDEVKAKGANFEVWVDLDDADAVFSIFDTQIVTSDPDVAMWSKGTSVVVSGIVKRVDSVLGSLQVDFEDGATVTATP